MKLFPAVLLALCAAAPTVASASAVDFEKQWDYGVDINGYYNGGTASDGSTGSNVGFAFVNVSGLSNDADFTYYRNAPTPLGTAYAHTFAAGDTAFINIAAGVGRGLAFYYSSPSALTGAVKAYSGLNGTGTLLGSYDLAANVGAAGYDAWTLATFTFGGLARSFDLTGAANTVLFDNIAAVPEPGTLLMMLAGATALVGARRRRR